MVNVCLIQPSDQGNYGCDCMDNVCLIEPSDQGKSKGTLKLTSVVFRLSYLVHVFSGSCMTQVVDGALSGPIPAINDSCDAL